MRAVVAGPGLPAAARTAQGVRHTAFPWPPLSFRCRSLTFCRLSTASSVEGFEEMAPDSAEFIHTVVEAAKLAFADREAY